MNVPTATRYLQRLHLDRAVTYALVARFWQVPAGAVSTVMIALFFSEEAQGIYYTLWSLIGMQVLADSGLINVLMHVVSHEWSVLRFDDKGLVHGPRANRQRLAAILRFGTAWFAWGSVGLVTVGSAIGAAVFAYQGVVAEALFPLLTAMGLAGCSLTLSPRIAMLEGCNQVANVNRFRLVQAITGSLVVWTGFVLGAELWVPALAVAAQLACEVVLVVGVYGRLFRQLRRTSHGPFDWRQEIWPLQWRLSSQFIIGYLAIFPLIPTLFAWQGPAVAGRVGMTWSVLNNLLLMSYAWVRTRAPEFGRLIANKQSDQLKKLFYATTLGSTGLLVGMLASFVGVVMLMRISNVPIAVEIATRFVAPNALIWFALAMVPTHLTQCFSLHLRSQKIDPIWHLTLGMNVLLGGAIFYSASRLNPTAVAISILAVYLATMIMVARVWKRHERLLPTDTD